MSHFYTLGISSWLNLKCVLNKSLHNYTLGSSNVKGYIYEYIKKQQLITQVFVNSLWSDKHNRNLYSSSYYLSGWRNCFSLETKSVAAQTNGVNKKSLFPLKHDGCTSNLLGEKGRAPLIKSESDGESRQKDCKAMALWWAHKSGAYQCRVRAKMSVIILKDSVFCSDCDINGDDHCLLGVTECEMCNAAILPLIHHCHALFL